MHSTIDKFAASGLISRDEASDACDAEAAGVDSHTIGYEVEILPSARPDIARAADIADDDELFWKCHDKLGPYGYTASGDGLYELQSPAAMHPHPLTVATHGLARFGWLPKKGTKGLVTSHISIGTSQHRDVLFGEQEERLVTMLRGVEMLGGTTPNRLLTPLRMADKSEWDLAEYSWNCKGIAGIRTKSYEYLDESTEWSGTNNRIEMRTLGYYNPKQFGALLNAVYYLTRGLLEQPQSTAGTRYDEYHEWLQNYYDWNSLPQIDNDLLRHPRTKGPFAQYFTPYAEHLADADLSLVRDKAVETIYDLREEFNMTTIPLDMNNLSQNTPSVLTSAG